MGPLTFAGVTCLTNLLKNFSTNLDFSGDFFLTYNLLAILSFRVGVPLILFFQGKFILSYCGDLFTILKF